LVLAPLLVAGYNGGAVFLLAWGAGGLAGGAWFLWRMRINLFNIFHGDLRGWIGETRHLSGWLTATAVLGQAQVQLVVSLVTGILAAGALALLRAAQYGLLMPAQNLQLAVSGLLVPRMSRLAGSGDTAGVSRLLRKTLMLTALCGLVPVALSPLAGPLLNAILPKYAEASTIAFPVALQAAIYLVQVPFTAALRGMQKVRSLFVQYLVFAAASAAGLVGGTLVWDLRGAAWGLTAGAFIGLITQVVLYRRALATLDAPEPGPDAETAANEAAGQTPVR
jgi:O-antigen/teichoic acid export membrane protein